MTVICVLRQLLPMTIQENIPLAPLTTMKVGGPARYFVEVKSEDEARAALKFARGENLPVFILGGGSNIVVSDGGFTGLVIKNSIRGFAVQNREGGARLIVGAGEDWDETVKRTVEAGLAGLENLSGIPGTVGAAPVQNIGAYGASADKIVSEVRGIDIETLEQKVLNRERCEFGYRDSIFKYEPGKIFITGVVFELVPGGAPDVASYPDVKKYFADREQPPTLQEMRRAIIEIRSRKGMVILPEYESFQSVGSFFKNPIVGRVEFEKIKTSCPTPWFWETPDGRVKISAACLIEQSGFRKGYREGRVGISPKHPLAIINLGGAKAREIAAFAGKIRDAVKAGFGICLEQEAEFVGPM